MSANFISRLSRLVQGSKEILNQYFHSVMNIFIGPFVCVAYWVPHIQSPSIKSVNFKYHSRIVSLICLSLTALLFNFTYVFSGVIALQLLLYGCYTAMRFVFPKGLLLGQVRLFSSVAYEYIDRVPSVIIHRGRLLGKEVLDRSNQGKRYVVHYLGSGDTISTYVSRLWGHDQPKGNLEDDGVFHICIEQPGIAPRSSAFGRVLEVLAALFILSFKFWCYKIGLYPSILVFAMLVPIACRPFYIRRYADSAQKIVQYLRSKGIEPSRISMTAFSLGGVAAMLWRRLYDKAGEIKVCLDRSPQVNRIDEYGSKTFFLPSIALACTVMLVLSLSLGFWVNALYILAASALVVCTLTMFKSLRASVLRFALKSTGNWSGLPVLSNLKVFNAKQDHVLGKEFRFNVCKGGTHEYDGDHMSTPSYDHNGEITSYSNDNKSYHNLVDIYEGVMSRLIRRRPPVNGV
jgi:hypothetical protein